ncbi:unnamed protein product [Victoria cruziana]
MDRANKPWLNKSADDHPWGSLGGVFSWPPRSYPCSFCRREFRSAQALGGHMNVHRRDRARLRESLSLGDDDDLLQHAARAPAAFPSIGSKPISLVSSSSTTAVAPSTENSTDGPLVGTPLKHMLPPKAVAASSSWFCHSKVRGFANQEKVEEKQTEGVETMSSRKLDRGETLPSLVSPVNGSGVGSLSSNRLENGIDLELRLGYGTNHMSKNWPNRTLKRDDVPSW